VIREAAIMGAHYFYIWRRRCVQMLPDQVVCVNGNVNGTVSGFMRSYNHFSDLNK